VVVVGRKKDKTEGFIDESINRAETVTTAIIFNRSLATHSDPTTANKQSSNN
jgi:hypothetical protein